MGSKAYYYVRRCYVMSTVHLFNIIKAKYYQNLKVLPLFKDDLGPTIFYYVDF